ncbi:MAG: hypothetical protein LBC09_06965, partial [Helicobacteraceae bacterium]|nr:hypothetical protein [Helicobacteraceae bacterium]
MYRDATIAGNPQRALDLANFYRKTLKDYPKAIEWYKITYDKEQDETLAYSIALLYDDQLK